MPVPTTSVLRRTSVSSSYTPRYSYHSSSLDRTRTLSRYSSYSGSDSIGSYGNSYFSTHSFNRSSKPPLPPSANSYLREYRSSDIKYGSTEYRRSISLTTSSTLNKYSVDASNVQNDRKNTSVENILNRYNSNSCTSLNNDGCESTSSSRRSSFSNSYNNYNTSSILDQNIEPTKSPNYTTQTSLNRQKTSESLNSVDSGYTSDAISSSRPWRRRLSALQDNSSNGSSAYSSVSNSSSNETGASGLQNLGNTCFMNSILQCLAHTRPLLDYCLKDNYSIDINSTKSSMKGVLIKEFSNLLQMMWKKSTTAVNPHGFKSQVQRFAPRFSGYNQQDAQEFLRYVLQGLHEDVNHVSIRSRINSDLDDHLTESQKASECWRRYLKTDDSRIVDIFVGQLKSTLKCCFCGNTSVTFDPFWDLSLPITKSYSSVNLTECLDLFTSEEILTGDEMPLCSKCKVKRKSTKSLSIQKFPQILVLHLKRFTPGESYRAKLSTKVDFPLSLDLNPYSTNTCSDRWTSYSLYAVSNHSGSTSSGHYTAYCKHPYTKQWLEYNDSRVTDNVKTSDIVTSGAYILFYEMSGRSSRL